jgi:hypothetical protein
VTLVPNKFNKPHGFITTIGIRTSKKRSEFIFVRERMKMVPSISTISA